MHKGAIIKHKAFMDVAFLVDYVRPFANKYKIKGKWINQGYDNSFVIDQKDKFEIEYKNLSNWFICLEPEAKCIRNVKWRKLK